MSKTNLYPKTNPKHYLARVAKYAVLTSTADELGIKCGQLIRVSKDPYSSGVYWTVTEPCACFAEAELTIIRELAPAAVKPTPTQKRVLLALGGKL